MFTTPSKKHHIISAFAIGGIAFVAFNFSGTPLFGSTDQFVLFAQEEIKLEQDTQVSSGDVGSNGKIDIEKDIIVNGNLFADTITIDKNTSINGNASFNKLKLHKDSQILGTQTNRIQLPIANLPEIPEFQIGTEDFKLEGTTNTLPAGNYRNITLEKNSRLTLTGGIYNIRILELKGGAVLIFNAPTTINIQFKLRGYDKVSILPGLNQKPDDLKINYLGIKPKKEKDEQEDDDDEINLLHDEKEYKDGKIGRPVIFGKNSFLNFKLLAPKANVYIEKESTVRGRIVAGKIKIGKDSILSLEQTGFKIAKPEDIITDPDGGVYPINEILVSLMPEATILDAQDIVASINGRVVGVVSSINLYQIEVSASTIQELENLINALRTNPQIDGVFRNFVVPELVFPLDGIETLSKIDEMTPAVVKIIFTTSEFLILFLTALFLSVYYLYIKRDKLYHLKIIKDKLFYSNVHFWWYVALSVIFLLFPFSWAIDLGVFRYGGVPNTNLGIPFITGGYPFDVFGLSVVGSIFNLLYVYALTFGVVYLKRNFRKRRVLIAIVLLFVLMAGGAFLIFVRFILATTPFMPAMPYLLRTFGYEAQAASQIKYDLENLRNQNSSLAKAYDIIKIQQAWDAVANATPPLSPVIVGVVDFGVEAIHQEFNFPEVNLSSVNRSLLVDFTERTFFGIRTGGHGTQVTGIIGANNRSRTAALPSDSPQMNGILSGVLSENQYTLEFKPIGGPKNTATSTLIQIAGAVEAALEKNSQVINMSFGLTKCSELSFFTRNILMQRCYKTDQEFLDDSMAYQRQLQQATSTLFVVSAGNNAIEAVHSLPGALSFLNNVITVGATNMDDKRAGFSNYGPFVGISAPVGMGIYAPAPRGRGNFPPDVPQVQRDYDQFFSGTSASAPMITGVAGLIKAVRPHLTPSQIKQVLISTGDSIQTDKPIGPRLNALNAICHPLVLNCAPPVVTGVIQGSISLEFEGGPVEGAIISLFVTNTNQRIAQTTSDAQGFYRFDSIPVGNYFIGAEKDFGVPDVFAFGSIEISLHSSQIINQDIVIFFMHVPI